MTNPDRIIFDETVQRSDVESVLQTNGYQLVEEQDASDQQPWTQAWLRDEDEIMHVEDAIFGFRYLAAQGERAKDVLQAAVAGLKVVTLGDALKCLVDADDIASTVSGLGLVAACAPPAFDPRVFAAVGSCFSHTDRTVRFAAIAAAMYANWAEFARPLEELARLDSDFEIAQQARLAASYVVAEDVVSDEKSQSERERESQ
jgi:hypothetical protein